MKQIKSLLFFFIVFLFVGMQSVFAYDQYESIKVGETKTFYFPSEVTSRAGSMYSYNCSSDHINNVEVVSYTSTSVTVKALAYTQSTVNIRFDYWWYENNYGRNDTHMVHLDMTDNYTPDNNPNLNPDDYYTNQGCWGTVNIEMGDTKTVYCQFDTPNPDKVVSIGWAEDKMAYGFEITSQSQSSCTIRGRSISSGEKLWCLMKYGNSTYKAYYLVNSTQSTKPTLTLSANPAGGNVDKGTTVYLTASPSDANIYYTLNGNTPTTSSTKYTSSGITINESCTLKAVAVKSGYNNSPVMTWVYTVTEQTEATDISVSPSSKTIKVGDTFIPTYTLTPSNATTTVTWSSDDSGIASVNSSTGKVMGVKAGKTYIRAKTSNGKTDYCVVTVEGAVPTKDVVINEANFPDANFRKYLLEQDYGKDGIVTEEEIEGISFLNIGSPNISSLRGIEYFMALTVLICPNMRLTELDVSQNMELTYLHCDNNQLAALDVSKNMKLETLYCSGNQLIALDVAKNTELTSLACDNNQLTALDVSQNTKLTSLICNNNQLTALDVSPNTKLTVLSCENNQLMALDVSKNTKLGILNCYNDQLTVLDVSKNTELTALRCYKNQLTALDVSQNTKIETLECGNNPLTALDVSQNTKLKTLECYNDQLTVLDVSKNTELTALRCYNNQLTTLDVSQNTKIETLECDKNPLTALDVSKNTKLKTLECYNDQLTVLDVSKNTELTALRCYNNPLTALVVSKNTKLRTLECYNNQLITLDVSGCTALEELDCSRNQLTSLDVSGCAALEELDCSGNHIQTKAMDAFIESLPQKTYYTYPLYIYDNTFSEEGNICTKSQVERAQKKGWSPRYYIYIGKWEKYEGMDDAVGIAQPTIESIDKNAPIYNLAGQKVESLQGKKGVYIVDGKKVFIK